MPDSSRSVKGIHIYLTDDSRRTYQCHLIGGDEDIELKRVDRSKHQGIKDARYGYGKLKCLQTEDIGPSVQIYGSIYNDDSYAFEMAVLNDSIQRPLGQINGRLAVLFNGQLIHDSKVNLYDQTGVAFRFGDFNFSPRMDLLEPILEELPDVDLNVDVINGWTQQANDPDPVHNTHRTGSPRNKLLDLAFSVYKYGPKWKVHTRALHDWVLAQIGMKGNFDGNFIPGRPHWLSDDNTGQIYDYDRFYNIDSNDQWPLFGEDGVLILPYRDSFGRKQLDPSLLQRGTRIAHDIEHLEVESLFAAAVLLGSEFAYRAVELIAQEYLDKTLEDGLCGRGYYHSSRTLAWGTNALLRAYQLTGKEKYLRAFRTILDNAFTGRWTTLMGKDYKKEDFPLPWIQSRSSGYVNTQWNPDEAMWQAGIAGSIAFRAALVDPDPVWRAKFENYGVYAADCVRFCYTPNGYYENYGFNEATRTAENELVPTKLSGEITWIGTRFWALDCMTRAWLKTGLAKYEEACKTHWEALKDLRAGGWHMGRPGNYPYHTWYYIAAKFIDPHN